MDSKQVLNDALIKIKKDWCVAPTVWICCTVCLLEPSCTFRQHRGSHQAFLRQVLEQHNAHILYGTISFKLQCHKTFPGGSLDCKIPSISCIS